MADATVHAMLAVLALLAFGGALPFDSLLLLVVGLFAVARVGELIGY